ncbi:DUF2911 domain-containing protein [Postechiella marina]|uniref:DUF2911 domain-containing protein n=1 Tax=Postechiella marina TaxID=943941 RepID=A0ABP8CCS5_9FLAO
MKKLVSILMVFTLCLSVNAQVKTPAPSPFSKLEQKVGLTDITLEYSRPGVKGRTVFGNLVPYGKIWRTGANARTKITFSTDVVVSGQTLEAGSYSIFTVPNAKTWDVVFYNEGKTSGTPKEFDAKYVAAKATVDAHTVPFDVESFTIDINNISNDGARLEFIWEKTWVGLDFTVPTDKMVVASIEKVMNGADANDYFASAMYYLQADKDINQAKIWIDKAINMSGDKAPFWQLRQQSLIYAKAGDKKGAIAAAKKSLEKAIKAGNDDYVKMNKDSLKEWGVK